MPLKMCSIRVIRFFYDLDYKCLLCQMQPIINVKFLFLLNFTRSGSSSLGFIVLSRCKYKPEASDRFH